MKTDITSKQDIEVLVSEFYKVAAHHESLSRHFEGLDWERHLPRMISFWSFIILDEMGYKSNMLEAHTHLDIKPSEVDVWLAIFHQTIDSFFEGERADFTKQRATSIAWVMKSRFKE